MALDYAKCAKEIYETLGGRENLVSAAHCGTLCHKASLGDC